MTYSLSLFLLLIAFWAANSGIYTSFVLLASLVSIIFVIIICRRMRLLDYETLPLHLLTRILPFYCWLIKEIVIGSCHVLKLIFQGEQAISPTIVTLKLNFTDELSRVIFANSVTLVPGTLCIKLDKHSIQVHALTQALADELLSGKLAQRVKRLES